MDTMIVCPDCDGDGYIEYMTGLTYDGDQTWGQRRCERCAGSGVVKCTKEEEEINDC